MPASSILPAAASVTMCNGPVTLTITGTGLTYQWLRNGTAIAGATNATYAAGTAGLYTAIVSNGACSATITGPNVISAPNPVISFNTTGGFLFTGIFASYQWYLNGSAVTGATGNGLVPPAFGNYVVVVTDSNGCTDTSAVYAYTSTNIATTAVDEIKVYPNPASTTLFIDAAIPVKVSIVSPDGKVLLEGESAKAINVRQLATGIYMLMIYDEHDTLIKVQKFSKLD
jgi:hypothetical protein